MNIVEAQPKDLPRIVELKQAMFEEVGKSHLLAPDFESLVLSDYRRLYELSKAHHFLAVDGGMIVAMAGGFIKSDIPYRYFRTSRYGFVGDVYTLPMARKRGLATRLNALVLGWLKNDGVDMVRLLASDAARPVYEGLGFEATHEMALVFRGR